MAFKTLISTSELAPHLDDPEWAIVDCRFSLTDSDRGHRDYLLLHISSAIYANLDDDLSGPVKRGVSGRHPLPSIDKFAQTLSKWGIASGVQVVAYDDLGGALAAARLWWMLRWLGHEQAAVLDGGWQRWLREKRSVRKGEETRPAREFIPRPRMDRIATADEVEALCRDQSCRIFDCRTTDRYHGQNETLDPVAGHIPSAISVPYVDNLSRQGTFLSAEQLRLRYQALLGDTPAERAVFYCGSGVTSAHNILAMVHAGLGEPRLYVGSWSEWIADPRRLVITGEDGQTQNRAH